LAKVNFEPVNALRLQPSDSVSNKQQRVASKVILFIQGKCAAAFSRLGLLLEHFFHVTDLALHLAACFFDRPSIA
jgi:hypothetical protein